MPSTVIKSLCIAVALFGASAGAQESDHPPRFLHDPVLGLRLPVADAKLEPVPEAIRALCAPMADSEISTGRQWIFGMVKQPTATYYLVDGYAKLRNPQPDQAPYFKFYDRGVYTVSGGKCDGDQAREAFDVGEPKHIPQKVLRQLARDLATRLVRAAGGADRLRSEIANQRIDFQQLSPEIQQAFKAYFRSEN
ncbi:MAG: hypothetical protein V4754_09420 [Pseudomonadota bacterium]